MGIKNVKNFIHPFLFGIYPIVFLYSHNFYDTNISELFLPLFVAINITLFFILSLRILLKNDAKTGAIISLFYILFFSYRSLFSLASKLDDGAYLDIIVFFVELILLGIGIFYIIKYKNSFRILSGFLNVFSIALISFSFFNITVKTLAQKNEPEHSEEIDKIEFRDNFNSEMLPNIYHLILDSYGREDVLKELYDYDNSDFTDYLQSKGFYVASKSVSNYAQTYLSLGSTLNLNYLEKFLPKIDPKSVDKSWWDHPIRDFLFFNIIKQYGYKIFAISSGYSTTELSNADVFNNQGYMKEFVNLLFNTTALVPVAVRWYKFHDQYSLTRKRIFGAFDNLKNMPQFSSPTYVFGHVLSPHPPFLFDHQGNPIDARWESTSEDGLKFFQYPGTSREKYNKEYGNQITFINGKLKEIINTILANAERPTIIIIQGDHGLRSHVYWENIDKPNFKESLSILNAYYFYDGNYDQLYENISPVNTFRVIFDQYLGLDYDLLDDRSYMSTWTTPYDFIEYVEKDTNTSLLE